MSEKLLGIDYGEKKVGLAIADTETKIASPYKILTNDKGLFEAIKDICLEEEIGKIVVGIPTGLKGVKSAQYEIVKDFISQLKREFSMEIIAQNENLSSSYAQNLLQGTKSKGQDDAVAAMIILQSYLDEMGEKAPLSFRTPACRQAGSEESSNTGFHATL
ncbi:MAG: Holliday junction resolvase RuvX [Patescibacteria group bacterium]